MIEAIKIIYDQSNVKEMHFWSELLQLMGIFTYEITQDEVRKFRNKNVSDYSVILILAQNMKAEDLEHLRRTFPGAVLIDDATLKKVNSVNIKTPDEKEIWKKYLNKWLNQVKEKSVDDITDDDIAVLNEIDNICINFNVVFYRILFIDLYENDNLNDILQEMQDNFVNAYVEMRKKQKNHSIYWYALACLGQYMNETCTKLSQPQLFKTEQWNRLLDKTLELDPLFVNAYLMKATLIEYTKNDKAKAEDYYITALDVIEQKEYASMPFYFCGRYYEKYLHDTKKAYVCYKKSQKVNPCNYKAVFKMASLLYTEKKWSHAIVQFEKTKQLLLLRNVSKISYVDYIYLLKTYDFMEDLYGYKLEGELEKYKNIWKEKQDVMTKFQNNPVYNRMLES